MTRGGHRAGIKRAVADCLNQNGLRGQPRDLETLAALWPLMRALAASLYELPLPGGDGPESGSPPVAPGTATR